MSTRIQIIWSCLQDLRATLADNDRLCVREDGSDGEAAGALDVHEEGSGSRDESLQLVLAGLTGLMLVAVEGMQVYQVIVRTYAAGVGLRRSTARTYVTISTCPVIKFRCTGVARRRKQSKVLWRVSRVSCVQRDDCACCSFFKMELPVLTILIDCRVS